MVGAIGGKNGRRDAGKNTMDVPTVHGISSHPWMAESTNRMQLLRFTEGTFYRRRRHLVASLVTYISPGTSPNGLLQQYQLNSSMTASITIAQRPHGGSI